jgi:hypothetical protein
MHEDWASRLLSTVVVAFNFFMLGWIMRERKYDKAEAAKHERELDPENNFFDSPYMQALGRRMAAGMVLRMHLKSTAVLGVATATLVVVGTWFDREAVLPALACGLLFGCFLGLSVMALVRSREPLPEPPEGYE